ncbi:hypothetical protein [Mesorhizobium sp.]|uniref:hypothetical protein n=1 Tax=Mesorhizobium sp. TaxID=1871066 RepID=UPI000FE78882|nr:hypothetical protein [Mesorhizobium sp.]RWP05087.1 MAG: hypothetical protein EOQ99_16585 [Mesorhizobium sp.]
MSEDGMKVKDIIGTAAQAVAARYEAEAERLQLEPSTPWQPRWRAEQRAKTAAAVAEVLKGLGKSRD